MIGCSELLYMGAKRKEEEKEEEENVAKLLVAGRGGAQKSRHRGAAAGTGEVARGSRHIVARLARGSSSTSYSLLDTS